MAKKETPSAAPFGLTQKDLEALIDKPVEVDTTQITVGTAGAPPVEISEREQSTYVWSRQNYHDFVDRVRAADLEGPIAVQQLREYVMRQLVALSGHPDSKTAIKALELLGKVKNVGLFDEKRSTAPSEDDTTEAVRRELAAIAQQYKK